MNTYLTDQQVIAKLHEGEIEAVIINYMPFASYLADRMSYRCFTHERSDLKGEAYLALVAGVNRLVGHPNPKGFLTEVIRGHLINIVKRSYLIKRPDDAKRLEQWMYLEDVGDEAEESSIPKEFWAPFDQGQTELENLIGNCLFSELEKRILKLKIDGYTIEEIALQCQLPYVQTHRILQGTKSRVVKILKGEY